MSRKLDAALAAYHALTGKEWVDRELEEAANLEDIAEEAFDVMQALTGYLITLGVDLPRANRRHINKLRRRENER